MELPAEPESVHQNKKGVVTDTNEAKSPLHLRLRNGQKVAEGGDIAKQPEVLAPLVYKKSGSLLNQGIAQDIVIGCWRCDSTRQAFHTLFLAGSVHIGTTGFLVHPGSLVDPLGKFNICRVWALITRG